MWENGLELATAARERAEVYLHIPFFKYHPNVLTTHKEGEKEREREREREKCLPFNNLYLKTIKHQQKTNQTTSPAKYKPSRFVN